MAIKTIRDHLAENPVFSGFDGDTLDLVAGCGHNVHFEAGDQLLREGTDADAVILLRHGDVAIEVAAPQKDPLIVETLHEGDIVDWSWLVPPYRNMSDARALTDVRAISLDAGCIRGKCDDYPKLGYQMFKHWLPHLAGRIRAQRLQVLDLYGADAG